MIKSLIKVGLLLVVGILGYNYFLGSPEEKANSKKIINDVKDVGKSVGSVIKSEAEKFQEGKMDRMLAKMKSVMSDVEAKAADKPELKQQLSDLMNDQKSLQEKIDDIQSEDNTTKVDRKAVKKEIRALEAKFTKLMQDAGINIAEEE